MFKKFLFIPLFYTLILFANSLDGFNTKPNKFNNFYFIDQEIDWGNLYIEGLEVDFKAAVLAQRKLNGGYFDENIHSVIPHDFSQTAQEWKKTKDYIAYLIGPIPHSSRQESATWKNSSKSVNQLLQDAHKMALTFKNIFNNIASQTKTMTYFGTNDQFIVKSEGSLVRKVNQDVNTLKISKEEAIVRIGDTLRGTLIVDSLDKIPLVIEKIIQSIEHIGGKVAFKNLWAEDRESGYVGIHAKILFPLSKQTGSNLLAEMQIHLDSMVDGSELCAKERAHLIYEDVRTDESSNSIELSVASKLLFLTAMEEALAQGH